MLERAGQRGEQCGREAPRWRVHCCDHLLCELCCSRSMLQSWSQPSRVNLITRALACAICEARLRLCWHAKCHCCRADFARSQRSETSRDGSSTALHIGSLGRDASFVSCGLSVQISLIDLAYLTKPRRPHFYCCASEKSERSSLAPVLDVRKKPCARGVD